MALGQSSLHRKLLTVMRGYSNYWTRQISHHREQWGVKRRHCTGTEHRVNATVHSGRNEYLKRSGKYGIVLQTWLSASFFWWSQLSSMRNVWEYLTTEQCCMSWAHEGFITNCYIVGWKMNLRCWHAVGGKSCTLSHLKTQCLSSLLNPQALNVVTLNVAHHVK